MKRRFFGFFFIMCVVHCAAKEQDLGDPAVPATTPVRQQMLVAPMPHSAILPIRQPDFGGSFPSIFYHINSQSYSKSWYKKFEGLFCEKDGSLHIFAFNVGQGNCIFLRQGNELAIIDAGYDTGDPREFTKTVWPKITELLGAEVQLKAVFLTHPHKDHYNLISTKKFLLLNYMKCKGSQAFLGGVQEDWGEKEEDCPSTIFQALRDKGCHINFVTTELAKTSLTGIMRDVNFDILLPEVAAVGSEQDQNRNSLIIKVTCHGQSVLFAGDAEGEGVGRLIGHVENIAHLKMLSQSLPPKIAEMHGISEAELKKMETQQARRTKSKDEFFEGNRGKLGDVNVVFLPHHGSSTENSQRWMGFLSGSHVKTWFVSSSPEVRHKLPSRSIIERCPRDVKHWPHAFSYAGEGGTFEDIPLFQFTEQPIYVTGAAPGGAYWLKISPTIPTGKGRIDLYDAYPKDKYPSDESTLSMHERGWQKIS